MIADNLVKQLKSENELLQIQLQDLNYMIEAREEELDMLRKTAAHAVQLQSRLDHNLFEIEQMQEVIGEKQREAQGALKRESSLEAEMFQSIQMEREGCIPRSGINLTALKRHWPTSITRWPKLLPYTKK